MFDEFGKSITFTKDAIIHSDGLTIELKRDALNRIVAVIDPMGNTTSYTYDAAGDLIVVTNSAKETTKY